MGVLGCIAEGGRREGVDVSLLYSFVYGDEEGEGRSDGGGIVERHEMCGYDVDEGCD